MTTIIKIFINFIFEVFKIVLGIEKTNKDFSDPTFNPLPLVTWIAIACLLFATYLDSRVMKMMIENNNRCKSHMIDDRQKVSKVE